MNLMNTAIDQFILHEISALRTEEQRLHSAMAAAPTRGTHEFMRAIAALETRIESLDNVLNELDVSAVPLSSRRLHAA